MKITKINREYLVISIIIIVSVPFLLNAVFTFLYTKGVTCPSDSIELFSPSPDYLFTEPPESITSRNNFDTKSYLLQKIVTKKNKGKVSFLDILSIYFRHSVFISPPRTTIEKIYEDIFKSLDKRDYLNVRFFSAFLLALSTVNTSKALEEYSAIKKNFPILVNPLSLYSSIKNLRARAGLLYALTSKEFSSEFFSEVDEIMYELADFAKHLRWKYNSWRRGEQVSADDIEEFVSEFKDIAEEEQLGEKELLEDLSYYFDVIVNYLADSIEALVTNVLNLCLSSGEKAPDEIISKLIKLIDSVPMFDPSFKATIFSDLAIIEALTSLDPHLLEIAIRNTKAFCRRENKFYCDDLIELVGNRIGRIYYVTRDKAVLDFVLTLIEREDFFKNNRDLLRGFASGLYGLITLIDYSEKYCTMSSCH